MLTQSLTRSKSIGPPLFPTNGHVKSNEVANFNRHLNRCFFKVGDEIVFKKPKNRKIEGIIRHIEEDPTKVLWSRDRSVPYYIDVEITTKDERSLPKYLKTYESKIRLK